MALLQIRDGPINHNIAISYNQRKANSSALQFDIIIQEFESWIYEKQLQGFKLDYTNIYGI